MSDLITAYAAMRERVAATWWHRDVVRASGPDVVDYLHGQLSQDISNVSIDASTWSWLLQPHGKVDALVRITRSDDDVFLLDVDRGFGNAVIERLERFKLRTKADFELLDWKVLALRGPQAAQFSRPREADELVVVGFDWRGFEGIDLIGRDPQIPDHVVLDDGEAFEALRIGTGLPYMGKELDQRTIPAEAGINDRTISFKKGCYTGQELVARIDSRGGNVPRHLRALVIDAGEEVDLVGARVMPSGNVGSSTKPFGSVTSAAYSPRIDKPIALSFIRRDVMVPVAARVVTDEGSFAAHIEKIPLVSA